MMKPAPIWIEHYDYPLPQERIAKFPLADRDASKLLVYRYRNILSKTFSNLPELLPANAVLVFNNTKVVRARILFFKETGVRIEIFCLEPHWPADHETAFACKGHSRWRCMVGNGRKWKTGALSIAFEYQGKTYRLRATRGETVATETVIDFQWDADLTFGELLERLGKIPIPPYLDRESQALDNSRYQTVYSKLEGSVAAPTAGLHFTDQLLSQLHGQGIRTEEITLHVGAGTFLPVKSADATQHSMHTEHFAITRSCLATLLERPDQVIAVGTTSVRTLESLAVLGYRVRLHGEPEPERPIDQWEAYGIPDHLTGKELIGALAGYMDRKEIGRLQSATRIMITPSGFRFRVVGGLITNFHQPRSTLLLLISAFVGEHWRRIYEYALQNDFRFLSYGDSSLLFRD